MPHLVAPFTDKTYSETIEVLSEAHSFLVSKTKLAATRLTSDEKNWGIFAKRAKVDFGCSGRPYLIEKVHERIVEAINMTATLERMLDGLNWFSLHPDFQQLKIIECHPSTSSTNASNDLVLGEVNGNVCVRCEVTDVVGKSAGQNNKEKKDLKSLGCATVVPRDGLRRYICTSKEYSTALISPNRNWENLYYRYKSNDIAGSTTSILELLPAEEN